MIQSDRRELETHLNSSNSSDLKLLESMTNCATGLCNTARWCPGTVDPLIRHLVLFANTPTTGGERWKLSCCQQARFWSVRSCSSTFLRWRDHHEHQLAMRDLSHSYYIPKSKARSCCDSQLVGS